MKNRLSNRQLPISNHKKKVLIALSGGIDSAVSAYLLIKQGYYVEGAFMKNWTSQEGLLKNECPWLSDRRDALRVAGFLGIKLHTLDFEKQYQNTVMKYFFNEYKMGRTPNPDVMCNKEIKFKLLYNWAMKNGFDYLVTGHYAQIHKTHSMEHGIEKKRKMFSATSYVLQRSIDEFKDQTYFIYNIKKEQLPHLMFPIGNMKKSAVRNLARKIGLPNAEKKESMGLCFVGKIRLKDFLEQKIKAKKGEIVLLTSEHDNKHRFDLSLTLPTPGEGKLIGHHQGLHNYTIGQRQGINIGGGGPYYVISKDLKHNRLYVTNDPADNRLMTKEVQIHSVNLLLSELGIRNNELGKKTKIHDSKFMIHFLGRYRHQGELVPLTISKVRNDLYRVIFKSPQKAVASGQSLVLYKGKECVGGGIIV